MFKRLFLVLALTNFAFGMQAQNSRIELFPSADNTIYSESGSTSYGAGDFIYAGVTKDGNIRRALLRFDLSQLSGTTSIDSASLTLFVSKSGVEDRDLRIHKLISDWGEQGSISNISGGQGVDAEIGDATWLNNFYDTSSWSNPGGDFEPTATAVGLAGKSGYIALISTGMKSDIESWIANPELNFGWIAIVDESGQQSAKRFASREFSDVTVRPKLEIWGKNLVSAWEDRHADAGWSIRAISGSSQLSVFNPGVGDQYLLRIYSITGSLMHISEQYFSNGENNLSSDLNSSGIYIVNITNSIFAHSFKLTF